MKKGKFIQLRAFIIIAGLSQAVNIAGGNEFDRIRDLSLPGVTISVVEKIPAGSYTPPGAPRAMNNLPAFIRVAAVSRPTPASCIRIEVWMPLEDWNGRFVGTGNGGGAGRISYGALEAGVKNGFAVANTDMGTSPHVDSLISNPRTWEDFGHRATHEMTVVAKAVIERQYGRQPLYSYFTGCSTGGQQALAVAQRYPADYNGILAGAPANNRTHLHAMFLWNYKTGKADSRNQFTREQVQSVTDAVIAANAGKDGGYPGDCFLTDPRLATFNPDVLDTCLTRGQIDVLKKIYSGPVNPVTGEPVYTGMPLGSESSGSGLFEQLGDPIHYQLYPFRWSNGLNFNPATFDFDRDMERVDSLLAPVLNANSPDLEAFRAAGGKLLMYTGVADPLVPFQDAVHYYERVAEAQGGLEQTQTFFRYFLVPGMEHCGGGLGPCDFGQGISNLSADSRSNIFSALLRWVEKGDAPQQIIASGYKAKGDIHFQRPIYPYPVFPHYIEGKDPDMPDSYRGVAHERGKVATPPEKLLK
ncbi:MAG: tannase/feruloyl esterase family alpha/beta hydrolase [Tannerella sp.]|jgi:feruloyl esterase|nr:tannase/feruloyl esterase family alpha/beta hydrolase [Tannerella sp.]